MLVVDALLEVLIQFNCKVWKPSKRKPLSLIPTPNGVAILKRYGSSTGVRLNGFFVFHIVPYSAR